MQFKFNDEYMDYHLNFFNEIANSDKKLDMLECLHKRAVDLSLNDQLKIGAVDDGDPFKMWSMWEESTDERETTLISID